MSILSGRQQVDSTAPFSKNLSGPLIRIFLFYFILFYFFSQTCRAKSATDRTLNTHIGYKIALKALCIWAMSNATTARGNRLSPYCHAISLLFHVKTLNEWRRSIKIFLIVCCNQKCCCFPIQNLLWIIKYSIVSSLSALHPVHSKYHFDYFLFRTVLFLSGAFAAIARGLCYI